MTTVGVPTEVKKDEYRVGMRPVGTEILTRDGQKVYIQSGAGLGCGYDDAMYKAAGATILSTAEEIWAACDMIVKVKEPQPQEVALIRDGQTVFTYFHFAADKELTEGCLSQGCISVAYETLTDDLGHLPLLTPMSEVAGRMAVQVGARFLEKPQGGQGVLLGGVPGVEPAEVVIIGGGVVGINSAKMAVGMGAKVTILDVSADRMRYLDDVFNGRVQLVMSNSYNIARAVESADLLVGGVLIPGKKAPHLVTEAMVKTMKQGSVIVDVAIDQGGCIETIDRVTYHSDPVYVQHGVVHYSVGNMPGAVARTSTLALTNVTTPYAVQLANRGWKTACKEDHALALGINTHAGNVICKGVSEAFGYEFIPPEQIL